MITSPWRSLSTHLAPTMSHRHPVDPAPGPLEDFARAFDELFTRQSQRNGFRRYIEGLLLSAERNKTLTGLANTEPVKGATAPRAQHLQWFLSESTWSPDVVNDRRLELLRLDAATAPDAKGALVIDHVRRPQVGHENGSCRPTVPRFHWKDRSGRGLGLEPLGG